MGHMADVVDLQPMTLDGVVLVLIWCVAALAIVVAWHVFAWHD